MIKDTISTLPGFENAEVDHIAIQTGPRMLSGASALLNKLGFQEDVARRQSGPWGQARFFEKPGSVSVQLTDSTDTTPVPPNESHLALKVDNPKKEAQTLMDWLGWVGVPATLEEYNGKYFVTVPSLLTIPIEIVPR